MTIDTLQFGQVVVAPHFLQIIDGEAKNLFVITAKPNKKFQNYAQNVTVTK